MSGFLDHPVELKKCSLSNNQMRESVYQFSIYFLNSRLYAVTSVSLIVLVRI